MIFEKNVDQIVGVFTKTIAELEERAVTCMDKTVKEQAIINEATDRKKALMKEGLRANTLATKLSQLVSE